MKNDKLPKEFAFTKENYKLFLIGLLVIIIGYVLMAGGGTDDPNKFTGDELFSFRRITLAPLLVVGGYAFLMYAIMKKSK